MITKITDYGAISGNTLSTLNIQKAIDDCFIAGGGTVIVPSGDFLTGGILLRSGVRLHLEANAHLIASQNVNDYNNFLNDKIVPVKDSDKTDDLFLPFGKRKSYDFLNKCASRWNNALIRAIDAENISITGENGSFIDGMDCYDPLGEEGFRGPHAINFSRCKNITLSGYTVQNSANWAHSLLMCENISVKNITVKAGHDGIHLTSCENIKLTGCEFYTGDDCVAGIDNLNMTVTNCKINTSCNGFRLGGENILIDNCNLFGPGKFCHRSSLSDNEKQNRKITEKNHRFNMLSAFTYYADFSRDFKTTPGNIIIQNCRIENTERLLCYNFDNDKWQTNAPLKDITFKNVRAVNIKLPLCAVGSKKTPLILKFQNTDITFANDRSVILWWDNNKIFKTDEFIKTANFEKIILDNVKIRGINGNVLIKSWSTDGEIITAQLDCGNFDGVLRKNTNEEFINV
ncbi:MAG: glycosyl hydrolase family 28 protein [Clostridia bacterium]|nr:glycosyl hydrolase family 28 protein [Clostridia bacterium]